jgi:hypothetical protein
MLKVSDLGEMDQIRAEALADLITPEDNLTLAEDLADQDVLALGLAGIADIGGERAGYGDKLLDAIRRRGMLDSSGDEYKYQEPTTTI